MSTTKIMLAVLGTCLIATTGCQSVAKTSADAPDSATETIKTSSAEANKSANDDATSDTRRRQLDSNIRATEQRNNISNNSQASNRSGNDLATEVSSKLEANLPASALSVTAKDGAVAIAGTVPTKAQLDRIQTLAKEIKGVTSVTMKVAVAPAKK
jgi:hyperosmotically inducible periplasmic protein